MSLDRDTLGVVASFLALPDKGSLLRCWPSQAASHRDRWIAHAIHRSLEQLRMFHFIFDNKSSMATTSDRAVESYPSPMEKLSVIRADVDVLSRSWSAGLMACDNERLGVELIGACHLWGQWVERRTTLF